MDMNNTFPYRHLLKYIAYTAVFLWLTQWSYGQIPSIDNVTFEAQDSVILITYDLLSDNDVRVKGKYRIDLLLRKEGDREFYYRPKYTTGDIGPIQSAGKHKTITWHIADELPRGLNDADFYFEVKLIPLNSSDGSMTYVWLGTGAAVLAATGIVTYFIVSGDKSPAESTTPDKFPLPPGRPK